MHSTPLPAQLSSKTVAPPLYSSATGTRFGRELYTLNLNSKNKQQRESIELVIMPRTLEVIFVQKVLLYLEEIAVVYEESIIVPSGGHQCPELVVNCANVLKGATLLQPAFPIRRHGSGGVLRTHSVACCKRSLRTVDPGR